ncbi:MULTISPECIES: TetR/AcrR family transcriptional regulator [unclassified Rhizobium]|uniref:TetR/AcrR family transcriptional regulator n=1 Tax=unclassified Rhizobium TaxID=2613769 RepID=UPI001622070C|nr:MULTISPECIES: TetR/AcrR family transcriptional regulator [unclassified Rhizobium]MBB3381917.1 AcrR family transcriptional regulator [Rhizobium sp. BK098]MBB3613619.1 AcrR family transcriptional regulator [Rhizobium sp. BK609]MBB3679277.1 AcrR family transcriptional regulator [Rhizobium sp. BK612]
MSESPLHSRAMPRKAPRQARSLATVEAIVEAAARILEERGHEAFSTNAVAEKAGVSVGSLYQYFPRKDALIGALILRETSRLVAEAEIAADKTTGSEALSALILPCVEQQLRRPALARLLDFEEARLPLDAATEAVKRRFFELTRATLLRPDLPPQADIKVASRDVVAIIKGMVDAAGDHGDTDKNQLALRVKRAVLGYLHSLD